MDKLIDALLAMISALIAAVIIYISYIATPVWLIGYKEEVTAFVFWMFGLWIFCVMIKTSRETDKFRRRTHHAEHHTGECMQGFRAEETGTQRFIRKMGEIWSVYCQHMRRELEGRPANPFRR